MIIDKTTIANRIIKKISEDMTQLYIPGSTATKIVKELDKFEQLVLEQNKVDNDKRNS